MYDGETKRDLDIGTNDKQQTIAHASVTPAHHELACCAF
jgi:hypothetical protein